MINGFEEPKMKSLSSVGLGLSVVFGCLLLALIAEIYYLLWWKRRVTGTEIEDEFYSNPTREIFYIFCWKTKRRSYSLRPATLSPSQELRNSHKDLSLKSVDESFLESGLMVGPPRFLFTIEEETEELESEDGNSKGDCKILSELMMNNGDTPYMTPLSSPAFFYTPPSVVGSSHSHGNSFGGYNPLYESCTDVEFSKTRSSPPPKFKFLRDAEEKLQKSSMLHKGEEDGSFITILVDNI